MSFISDPSNSELKFYDGSRNAMLNSSWLLGTIPAANYSGTKNITFPDFQKSWVYKWDWKIWDAWVSGLGWVTRWQNWGYSAISANPQEWEKTTILTAVPSGANLAVVRIKLSRTQAPADKWHDLLLVVKCPENKTMPMTTSLVLEAGSGMSRIISVHIENGNLVLWQKQTVCGKAGGYGAYGDAFTVYNSGQGGEIYGPTQGIHIKALLWGTSWGEGTSYPSSFDVRSRKWDGSKAVSTADNSNYQSKYSIEIQAKFGRKLV